MTKWSSYLYRANDPNKFNYPNNSFYSYIESVVVSSNAKTLAQPTLLVQEGEKAIVQAGESVITGVSKNTQENGTVEFVNQRKTMGLTLDVDVQKIDDNGFISMKLIPEISVPIPAGTQEGVAIYNEITRKLESGLIRLRDRQTLILTGVIQDSDRQIARKWPLLGDLPLIGQLFRSSSSSRQKNELVIIVTPSILMMRMVALMVTDTGPAHRWVESSYSRACELWNDWHECFECDRR